MSIRKCDREAAERYLTNNPLATFDEFSRDTGQAKSQYFSVRKRLGLPSMKPKVSLVAKFIIENPTLNRAEVAKRFPCSLSTARKAMIAAGVEEVKSTADLAGRNKELLKLRAKGVPLKEISETYGLAVKTIVSITKKGIDKLKHGSVHKAKNRVIPLHIDPSNYNKWLTMAWG